jgi:ribosomal protein L11 methylase PrmA
MMVNELDTLEKQWNEQADEWNQWIGDEGDANRRESSDIYIWKYLTIKLALETRAKQIIGVDLSSAIVRIAKENIQRRIKDNKDHKRIEIHQDSVRELKSIKDHSIDLIIANYVLMDTPDLDNVIKVILPQIVNLFVYKQFIYVLILS